MRDEPGGLRRAFDEERRRRSRWRSRACASGAPSTIYDITAARPPAARPFRAQIRIAQPVATPRPRQRPHSGARRRSTLALLPGGRWPRAADVVVPRAPRRQLPERGAGALARRRRGDGRLRARPRHPRFRTRRADVAGPCRRRGADRRAATAAASPTSRSSPIREPVASTDAAAVAAALDRASSTVMTKIVAFVAKRL